MKTQKDIGRSRCDYAQEVTASVVIQQVKSLFSNGEAFLFSQVAELVDANFNGVEMDGREVVINTSYVNRKLHDTSTKLLKILTFVPFMVVANSNISHAGSSPALTTNQTTITMRKANLSNRVDIRLVALKLRKVVTEQPQLAKIKWHDEKPQKVAQKPRIATNAPFKVFAVRMIPLLLKQWNNKAWLLPILKSDKQLTFNDKELVHSDFKVDGRKISPVKQGALLTMPRYQFVWSKEKGFYRLKTEETFAQFANYTHYLIVSELTEKIGDKIRLVNYAYQTGAIQFKQPMKFNYKQAPAGHDWHQDLKQLIKTS